MRTVVELEKINLGRLQKKYHIWINTGESSFEVKTEADSSDHSRLHTQENRYTCTQCEKRFSSPMGICHHMNIHRGKFRCTECGKCCQSKSDLAVHRQSHSGEKPFECTVCGK